MYVWMSLVFPGCFEIQAKKQQQLHDLKMVWAELLLILQALCCSVHQVLGNNMTEALILYNDVGPLLTESFPKCVWRRLLFFPALLLMLLTSFFHSATLPIRSRLMCLLAVFTYLFLVWVCVDLLEMVAAGHSKGTAFAVILLWSSRRPCWS